MIIVRTPFRVSFFGGGTDYPDWFSQNEGSVLGTSIAYYCYIHGRVLPPFFSHKYSINWSEIEKPDFVDEIHHPVISEGIKFLGIQQGLEIHHHGDLPARSGLGSSSSFSASLLKMLYELKGEVISKNQLTKETINLEQSILNENVGVQDQILAVNGGFNHVEIKNNGSYILNPLTLSSSRLESFESHILMFYTGVSRFSSDIASESIKAIPKKQADLFEMQKMVDIAKNILLNSESFDDFGLLLNESWKIKRSLTKSISPTFINEIYSKAINAGALGGKLLGAGGGGFMIFYVQPEYKQKVLDALANLLLVPFKTEKEGSKVIFNQEQEYSLTAISGKKEFFKHT